MANIRLFKYITNRRNSFFNYACNFFQNSVLRDVDKQNHISKIRTCKRMYGDMLFREVRDTNLTTLSEILASGGYADNYIKGIFSTLKIAINSAVKAGLLRDNPTRNVMIKKGARGQDIQGISLKSLRLIEQTKYRHRSLRFVAKLFSFQCRTGLSYIDLISLRYDEICQQNGQYWLIGERNKTSKKYIIPLNTVCLNIIFEFRKPQKTSFKKHCDRDVFPFIKRGTYNAYLKKIGKITGIKEAETLSSHKARHTFAERMLEKGVSVESIRKMLGHSPRSQATWLYAKVTLKKLSQEIKKKC
jgi:site-specific recombinase XerD